MLKPSEMGVTGTKRPIATHRMMIEKKLNTFIKSGGHKKVLGEACMNVLNSPSGGTVDVKGLVAYDFQQIKNYFAECCGPVWSQERGLIPGLSKNDQTFFSNSDTERLYDFKVFRKNEEILVSNKQMKSSTNTLKPGDVVTIVNRDPDLSRKWQSTKYYKVFKSLNENNVISGPITAVWKSYPRYMDIPAADYLKVINQMVKNDVVIENVPKSIMKLIQSNKDTYAKFEKDQEVSGTMINFLFEKVLVEQSQTDSKYDELFKDVSKNSILFFKFDLSLRGVVSYYIADPNKAQKRATLRSKNGVERRSSSGSLKLDKLGFQM